MRPSYSLPIILSCLILACLLCGPLLGNIKADGDKPSTAAAEKDKPKKDGEKKDEAKDAAKKEAGKKEAGKKEAGKKEAGKKEAGKKEAGKKEAAACKNPTYELKKEPFVIKVSLNGTFEAQKMTEVVIRPEQWSGFTVLEAVEHGAEVKKGDLLVALDTEKIDRAIADMRTELRLAGLALKKAEKELQAQETVAPLELAALERSKRIADEDYDYFFKHELPLAKETVDFQLKSRQNYLDYQKEELRQLEKMYKADEITEETEEIILRRTRDSVEEAGFYLKVIKDVCSRILKYNLPRQESYVKESHKRQNLKYQSGKALFPLELEIKRIEFEKMKVQHEWAEKKLKDILADRDLMTIKSPADGIVYYGRCANGKWSGGQSDGRFDRDSSLPTRQAFMTIVQARPMRIAAQVPEKDLYNVRGGLKGTAKPTGYPDVKLDVIVDDVASVPNGSSFEAKITAALDEECGPLMPGMTCDVKLVAYEKKKALAVPLTSLKADPLDEDKFYVYVVQKDGKDKKREVAVGRRGEKKAEILKGLKAGEKILLVCPKDEKTDGEK